MKLVKNILIYFLVITFMISIGFMASSCKTEVAEETVEEDVAEKTVEEDVAEAKEPVTVTFTSWQANSADAWNGLFEMFNDKYDYITAVFEPIPDELGDYNTVLGTRFSIGEGPDVTQLHIFDRGLLYFTEGYIQDLTDMDVLKKYGESSFVGGKAPGGEKYGLPFLSSGNGIYYNKDIFAEYNLEVPDTWAELIEICETLEANGIQPFIGGGLDVWYYEEILFPGIAIKFLDGEEGRQKLLSGEIKFTDKPIIDTFKAIEEIISYHNDDFLAIENGASYELFFAQQGAMKFEGSWLERAVDPETQEFEIGFFTPPPIKAGDPRYMQWGSNFIGLSSNSKNPAEALLLLEFMSSEEFIQGYLRLVPAAWMVAPGDYEYISDLTKEIGELAMAGPTVNNPIVEKLNDGQPSVFQLIEEAIPKMIAGEFTPEQAAAHVQEGLEIWYEPYQN